jgi:hypothetical protein
MTMAPAGIDAEAEELIALLEDENRALARMDLASVTASLNRKRQLVERIAQAAMEPGEKRIEAARARRLAAASKRNAALLDAAIAAQRELMKILGTAMRGAEQRQVYVRQGQTAALTRSTGWAIATSA